MGCGLSVWAGCGGIEAIYSASIAAGDKMPAVHGNLDALVAQLLFHVNRAFTLAQQQAGVSMPDVVNTHFQNACLGRGSLDNPPDVVLLNRVPRIFSMLPIR